MATKKEVTPKAPKLEAKTTAPKAPKAAAKAPKAEVKVKAVKTEVKAKAPKAVKVETAKVEIKAKATKTPKAEVAPVAPAKKAAAAKSLKAVTFSLPKEAVVKVKSVALVGDFNNWAIEKSIALTKQKDGSFKTTVELESGKEYQYRFLLNGETWENAWDAPKYVASPFGGDNSVVFA
jgi:hypothetical protein